MSAIACLQQLSMIGLLPDMPLGETKFQTARTRRFRAGALFEEDERTISHVEEFGCSVVNIKRTEFGLGWSYTVGIFDTSGKPEIITVGLSPETAHFALNEAAKLLRSGVDLTAGRHSDLIGRVDCEFRPVDRKWVEHLMGWALWYYDGDDFSVVKAVYPDLQNRFPEDEGFDKSFEQPLMQPDAPMTRAENDFWASADPKSSLFNWKFPDDPHARVFLSETVHSGTEPVTYVSHDVEAVHGSFWVTVCPMDVVPSSLAFTTRSTAIQVWLNWLICRWAGMRSGVESESRARKKHSKDDLSE
jgi:hypothetical protein